jgi:hypothetical protein
MKLLISSFIVFFGLLSFKVSGQPMNSVITKESELVILLDSLRKATTDMEKVEINYSFKDLMQQTLSLPDAFAYSFSQLETVGFINSPDGKLRIVNWNLEMADKSHRYFCFILHYDAKTEKINLHELTEGYISLTEHPDYTIYADNWYGCLYYKIIPFEKGSKTLYTLLGWDGNNEMSGIKLIDVLSFSSGDPVLGASVFKKSKSETLSRVIFEFNKKAYFSLKYEEDYSRIVFDHLMPETPNLEGLYSFYVPDLSYDSYVLDGNKWLLYEDVVAVNPEGDESVITYVKNKRTGVLEEKKVKGKWLNPEDNSAPLSGIEHKAVTPEMDVNNPLAYDGEETMKKEKKEKKEKADKRDPNEMTTTLGNKKRKKIKIR